MNTSGSPLHNAETIFLYEMQPKYRTDSETCHAKKNNPLLSMFYFLHTKGYKAIYLFGPESSLGILFLKSTLVTSDSSFAGIKDRLIYHFPIPHTFNLAAPPQEQRQVVSPRSTPCPSMYETSPPQELGRADDSKVCIWIHAEGPL